MYYRRNQTFSSCRNGAVYLKSQASDKTFRIEGTGRRIWELLEYPVSIDEIARRLSCEFSGNAQDIVEGTAAFLNLLLDKGFITQQAIPPSLEERQRFRYLHLLKRSLVNLIYPEHELRIRFLEKYQGGMEEIQKKRYLRDIPYREPELYRDLIDSKHAIGPSAYRFSHTMISLPALENIERCSEIVFLENIPGDFMEAGVCQGGATIFMRALQVCYGQQNRKTWVADSFQGVPKPESQPVISG